MRRFLKAQLEQKTPALSRSIRAIRNRRYFRQKFTQLHEMMRKELFPDHAQIVVLSGPFRGLRYFDEVVWGAITPKWLGSYEAELHEVIGQVMAGSYTTIIDVGCAEGYYAVGLAVALPTVRVIAFDTDFISRKQVRRLAELNQVSNRIQIETFCHHADLDAYSQGKTLVICDIEGFESELLNPEYAASLIRNDILVEVHESSDGSHNMENLLESRFARSHRMERIVASTRELWVEDYLRHVPHTILYDVLKMATDESRASGQVWLWMQAN